ncbi:MAG: hypothetical protein E7249_07585 [Paenibacillaceae bacterium]|nr:hypothetical protein [Paenibacillaceae bacterium]
MKTFKKVVSVFMCALMLFMAIPITTNASDSTWSSVFIVATNNDEAYSNSFYCEKGAISCDYFIEPNSKSPIFDATFTLREFINGQMRDVEKVTVSIDMTKDRNKGIIFFNKSKSKIGKRCEIKFESDKPVKAVGAEIQYLDK